MFTLPYLYCQITGETGDTTTTTTTTTTIIIIIIISPGSVLLLGLRRGKARPPVMCDDITAVSDGDKFL